MLTSHVRAGGVVLNAHTTTRPAAAACSAPILQHRQGDQDPLLSRRTIGHLTRNPAPVVEDAPAGGTIQGEERQNEYGYQGCVGISGGGRPRARRNRLTVASIKPNAATTKGDIRIQPGGRFTATGVTAKSCWGRRWGARLPDSERTPAGTSAERWDINAVAEGLPQRYRPRCCGLYCYRCCRAVPLKMHRS